MNAKQLKEYIIIPTLSRLSSLSGNQYKKIYTQEAVKLLLMTAAVESNMGHYIVQNNDTMEENKKAVSIYQIEKPTIDFVFKRKMNNLLLVLSSSFGNTKNNKEALISNLTYATAFCRVVYWYKTKEPIPSVDDNEGLWEYYKKWYNSALGSTTKDKFFNACKKHKVICTK